MKLYSYPTILVSLILCILCTPRSQAQSVQARAMIERHLPVIDLTIESDHLPRCEHVEAPEGSYGIGITNVEKIPGRCVIYDADGTVLYDSGEYEKKRSGMTVKVRGNTSALREKKQYKIKLEKSADLLMRGDESKKDRNWALQVDPWLDNYHAFTLSRHLGMEWTPTVRPYILVINNNNRGLYLLSETTEASEGRIKVGVGGFIAERDPYWWNENGEYLESLWHPQYNYTLKHPEYADLIPEQKEYITATLQDYDRALLDGTFAKYLDVRSAVLWLIGNDILGTNDGGGNMFLSRFDGNDDTKIRFTHLWDMESACNVDVDTELSTIHPQYFGRYMANRPDFLFEREYVSLWESVGRQALDKTLEFVNDTTTTEYSLLCRLAAYDRERWGDTGNIPTEECNATYRKWLTARRAMLDNVVADFRRRITNSAPQLTDDTHKEGVDFTITDGVIFCHARPFTLCTLTGIVLYHGSAPYTLPASGLYILSTPSSHRIIRR